MSKTIKDMIIELELKIEMPKIFNMSKKDITDAKVEINRLRRL